MLAGRRTQSVIGYIGRLPKFMLPCPDAHRLRVNITVQGAGNAVPVDVLTADIISGKVRTISIRFQIIAFRTGPDITTNTQACTAEPGAHHERRGAAAPRFTRRRSTCTRGIQLYWHQQQ